MNESVEELLNCKTLKRQFALELWSRTFTHGLSHRIAYEAAEAVIQRFYPHATSPASITQLACAWVNDAVVQETYLRIENATAQDDCLPTRSQVALLLADMLDDFDAVARRTRSGAAKHETRRMRSLFLANSELLMQVLGESPR